MLWFVSIFFFATTVWLFIYIIRTRRLLADLRGAVRAQRRLLSQGSDAINRWHGLSGLIEDTNNFIDQYRLYAVENTGYTKQVESMLGAIQEAVVVFDGQRVVEFANKAASELFNNRLSMKGLSVESAMRSLSLLEFLEAAKSGSSLSGNQVSIERNGEVLWFEASCTEVRSITEPKRMSSLLVLHDITRLKGLEVMRRDFVANVSHELRTPLTIIKGFTEALVDDHEDLPLDMRARYLGKIQKNAGRLHMLVEDLMILSRLESNTDDCELVIQPIANLLEEVYEDYQGRLGGDQVFEVSCDDGIPEVAYDRFRIRQVFDNLVANVFRYAPEFTKLQLRVVFDASTNHVICSVEDDGPGIPEGDLSHLFERFYRVDKGRSQERGGTGLGLSIAKHIVQAHEGRVWAESSEGYWTRISFSLPAISGIK